MRIIGVTYPNLLLIGLMYGTNERIGLEGLEFVGKRPADTSKLGVLVEIYVECLVEWLAMGGDANIVPERILRSGIHTADDDLPQNG